MLDVDGQVISADVLVERIEHLLEAVQSGNQTTRCSLGGRRCARGADGRTHPRHAGDPPADAPPGDRRDRRPPRTGRIRGQARRAQGDQLVRRAPVDPSAAARRPGHRILGSGVQRRLSHRQRARRAPPAGHPAQDAAGGCDRADQPSSAGTSPDWPTTWPRRAASSSIRALQSDIRPLTREITSILDRLGAIGTTGADIDYVGFEDRFRGSTDELRASQERYLTLFPPSSVRGGSSTSVAAGARCSPFCNRPVTR